MDEANEESPQAAWRELGRQTQREVRRHAQRGELHPDPKVRRVSVAWARHLTTQWRSVVPRLWLLGVVAHFLILGGISVLFRALDVADLSLAAIVVGSLVLPANLIGFELWSASRIVKAAEKAGGKR